ncbi:MAG: hypothetical protein V7K58_21345 [Nostoc sp.]
MHVNLGTDNLKNTQLFIVGWATREPVAEGWQDFGVSAQSNAAHPTRLNNFFIGSPFPLNKAFNGRLEEILVQINNELWQDVV